MNEKIKIVRQDLKEKSNLVKPLVQMGEFDTINEALINKLYKSELHNEFKPLVVWNKEGKKVKKGEKAFTIWGKPRKAKNDDSEDEFSFFPVCYVFSNKQVA
jgi:hypothetical protein